MTVTKMELQDSLSQAGVLEGREAKVFVDTLFEGMRSLLEQGHDLTISNFGIFELRDKAERPGRNLKTGVMVPVKARRVVTFHPCQKLKESVAALDTVEPDEA